LFCAETIEVFVVETGQPEIEAIELQIAELSRSSSSSHSAFSWVSVQAISPRLGGARTFRHMHGHHLEAKRLGSLKSGVADDHHHLLVDDDGLAETEFGNRGFDRIDGGGVVARVRAVGTSRSTGISVTIMEPPDGQEKCPDFGAFRRPKPKTKRKNEKQKNTRISGGGDRALQKSAMGLLGPAPYDALRLRWLAPICAPASIVR